MAGEGRNDFVSSHFTLGPALAKIICKLTCGRQAFRHSRALCSRERITALLNFGSGKLTGARLEGCPLYELMVPTAGFELATARLQIECSTN